MNQQTTVVHDRMIWMALLSVMAAALVAGQARANLHAGARATSALQAPVDDRTDADRWCRLFPLAVDAVAAAGHSPPVPSTDRAGSRTGYAGNPQAARRTDAAY